MKYLLSLSIVLFLSYSCTQKQIQTTETVIKTVTEVAENLTPIPNDPKVKIGKLDNGLTYYIHENPKPENEVELRLVLNAGSILEDEDQLGLAHFLEHMAFNGTKNFHKNELVDYLQSVGVKFGAHLNAYTSFDETVYILPVPSDNSEILEQGFQIIEDWAHQIKLTEEEIDKERGVVLEEYRLGLGADKRMMEDYLPKMLYGSKYVDRLPIGTKESLESFDYEAVRGFYNDWYRPDLMAVIAVGDINAEEIEQKIKDHFGHIKNPEKLKPRLEAEVPNHDETLISVVNDEEAAYSVVQVYYKDPKPVNPVNTVAEYEELIVEGLFTDMLNMRLDELRNSNNPPFIYGFAGNGSFVRNKNAFNVFGVTNETGQLTGLQAILTEAERVRQHGFTQGELNRAKSEKLANSEKFYNERDKRESSRIVGTYVNHFLKDGYISSPTWKHEQDKRILPTVSLEDVNGLIENYLIDQNRVVVFTGPDKKGLELVKEEAILDLMSAVQNAQHDAYEDKDVGSELMAERPAAGTITIENSNETIDTKSFELSNGVKVVYKKTDFKNDEIQFSAFSPGGYNLYPDAVDAEIQLAKGALTEGGINNFSKTDLNKIMAGKIANVRPWISSISEGMRGSSTPKDMETMFQMIYLYFTALNEDQEAFNSYRVKQEAFMKNRLSDPQSRFYNELNEFIYQNSPRYYGFPEDEDWNQVNYSKAIEIYRDRFADADDFTFIFVGNFEEDKLKELSKVYLATLPTSDRVDKMKDNGYRPIGGAHTKTIRSGAEEKSFVTITTRGETTYNREDDLLLGMMADVLDITLIEKLREEESGVYGVGASANLSKYPYGSYYFGISFPCGPENAAKLTASAMAELQSIVDNGPTQKDLDKVKEAMIQDFEENLERNNFWASHLYESEYYGWDPNEVLAYKEQIAKITVADIKRVANKYATGDFITATMLPEIAN